MPWVSLFAACTFERFLCYSNVPPSSRQPIDGADLTPPHLDDDDEHRASENAYTQPQGVYQSQPGYEGGYPDQPQMIPPSGGSISGSDRESIEEARKEYEEASSESDREEAREEYNEEVEEAYDD